VLAAARTFSFAVIASLTLGITVNATAFAFINAMFFRTFPGVHEQQRVVRIEPCRWSHGSCFVQTSSYDDYRRMRDALSSVSALAAYRLGQVAARLRGEPSTLRAAFVSTNYFDVLGARLPLGAGFPSGEQADHTAVISHDLWRRHYHEDPSVLGEFIDIGTTSVHIVGVAPEDFLGKGDGRDIWASFVIADAALPAARQAPFGIPRAQDRHYIHYIGRLAPAGRLEAARAEAEVFGATIPSERAGANERTGANVFRYGMRELKGERALEAVAVIMPLPLLVLVIACLNAASLLLARATYRMRETTVRLALGASRWRVVRYVLVESGCLALAAATLSAPLTFWIVRTVEPTLPMSIPIDWHVHAFTAGIAAAAALLFGLLPALRSTSSHTAIGSARPGDGFPVAPRLRKALVLVQIAASLGLLATGSQAVSAVSAIIATTGARDPERLLLASFDLDQLKMTPEAGQSFYRQLLERVAAIPEVESAGLAPATGLWTFGRGMGSSAVFVWLPEDDPKKGNVYLGGYAGGDLFAAVGLDVVQGRGFTAEDATVRPQIAMVNQPLAERMFGRSSAIGRTVRVSATRRHEESVEVRIVGVVEPTIEQSYSRKPVPAIYLPAPLQYEPALTLYARARTSIAAIVPDLRQVVANIDARVPFTDIANLQTRTEERNLEERLMANGATILGVVALVLATAGLYGLFSFIVSLRQREIGVRMALGAEPSAVLRLVLHQAMRLAVTGVVIGALIAVVAGAIVNANFFGTPSIDPVMFLASTGVLVAAMLVAGLIPARRAARVDPMVVLREE
jgi:predicted permease